MNTSHQPRRVKREVSKTCEKGIVLVEGKAFTGRAGGAIGNKHIFGSDRPYTQKPVKMIRGKRWVGIAAFHYKKDADDHAMAARKLNLLARVIPDNTWDYIVFVRRRE